MARLLSLSLLSLILLGFGGTCVLAQRNENDIAAQVQILSNHRQIWANARIIDYNYQYIQEGCAVCPSENFPWTTIVSTSPDFPQAKAIDSKSGNRTPQAQKVEDIFNLIQNSLAPQAQGGAEAVRVNYDPTLGYPLRALIIRIRDVNNVTVVMSGFETRSASPQVQHANAVALWESQRILDYTFQYWDYGPNPLSIRWPLTVVVRNRAVFQTRDANNNVVTFFNPPTMDVFLSMIGRSLANNDPFIGVTYSKRGFPEGEMKILTNFQGLQHFFISSFVYP